jgi:hypothetical protein
MRMEFKPNAQWKGLLAYRAYWLASNRDAWTTTAIRDASGRSGSFLGHQIEAALQFDIVPGNVQLETGIAHLFIGEFGDNAPNAAGQGDPTYGYAHIALKF